MPELPEVETVRAGLKPVLVGTRIARVEQRRPDLRFPLPERFVDRLSGRTILDLSRRSKYLLAHLDDGNVLVMHLGMTGRFTIEGGKPGTSKKPGSFVHAAGAESVHDHVVFRMAGGAVVTYNDARRFGFMLLIPSSELPEHPIFRHLGIEPLGNELSAQYLAGRAHGAKRDLKAFLMDQHVVAGLGNIYVCEALYRAGLSPRRQARTLADRKGAPLPRTAALVTAIRDVLTDALAAGGSTLRDYRQADGSLGYFQHTFAVYGREGEPCSRPGCRGIVHRITQAGRSTFACPVCQR
jgi:formamidopyrimidine-DNA glycosylase